MRPSKAHSSPMEGPRLFKKLLTAYSGLFFYAAPQTTWNSPEIIGIVSPTEWNSGSNAMPSDSAFEEFARDCVRLAELVVSSSIVSKEYCTTVWTMPLTPGLQPLNSIFSSTDSPCLRNTSLTNACTKAEM